MSDRLSDEDDVSSVGNPVVDEALRHHRTLSTLSTSSSVATRPLDSPLNSPEPMPSTPQPDEPTRHVLQSPFTPQRGSRIIPSSLPRGDLGSVSSARYAESPVRGSFASSRSSVPASRHGSFAHDLPVDQGENSGSGFGGGGNGDDHGNNGNLDDDDDEPEDNGNNAVIYGTTVNIEETMRVFKGFIQEFIPENELVDFDPFYMKALRTLHETGDMNIDVDASHLEEFSLDSKRLYKQMLRYPQEIIPILDLVVYQEFVELFGEDILLESGKRIQVRVFNLHEVRRMRELDPEDLDQLISLRGMIIRVSTVIPDMKQAFFRCTMCLGEKDVVIDRGVIAEPSRCEACNQRGCMELVHNRSIFADKQMIKLQESPENIPEGETPHTVSIYAYDSLVDMAKPGDRVEVTGILRAVPTRTNPMRRTVGAIYKSYVDVVHFHVIQRGSLADQAARNRGAQQTTEELAPAMAEEAMHALAADPELYSKLSHSIAPSIWGLDNVKKGVLLLLFGGTNKEMDQSAGDVRSTHRMRTRGELNVLLCGDPGTSKSQILSYVHKLAPRGIYTSGKGSSAVGLTAYVTKDPDTKELVLESGALVLSDRGVCCIDEFDKMADTTRAILHECMEQQTISIAKAGIIATLNARTSILASANPIESRYNPKLSMVQNIQLPPTLLSRFDLIYLVLDDPKQVTDRKLAKHLVQLYFRNPTIRRTTLDKSTITQYIAYAKANCFPVITPAASRKLVQEYVVMRQHGAHNGGKKTISATPRQLESLIRLAEAHAKIRLSPTVEAADVDEASRLMSEATLKSAVDPRTGTIDMDCINTGFGASDRNDLELLSEEVSRLLKERFTGGVRVFSLAETIMGQGSIEVTQEKLVQAIQILADNGRARFSAQTGLVMPMG